MAIASPSVSDALPDRRPRAEERYRLLADLARLMGSSLDLAALFQRSSAALHDSTDCDRISLILVAGGRRHGFALEFATETRWLEVPDQPLRDSAAAWVLQHRRIRPARRLDQARPFPEDRQLFAQGYASSLYLPLVCRNEGVGVLGLASRRAEGLDGLDLPLLREWGGLLAVAVDRAAAQERLAQLEARLHEEHLASNGPRPQVRSAGAGNGDNLDPIGDSRAMQEVRRAIAQVAETDSTVLIVGETGTGKELVARAIHERSRRCAGPLVPVHCAALAPGVLTSELFGHEAGAFTGAAHRRLGRFERAHGGSLFLDEIGDISSETQVLLLRALQDRVIERVGGTAPIPVDVRLLAATNRDLTQALAEGRFRSDLFYRLNVFPIRVPPLRERREDIPALIDHFVDRFEQRMGKPIAGVGQRTLDLAQEYSWPGNVRELENLVERAMIVTAGDMLEIDPSWLTPAAPIEPVPDAQPSLAERERRTILEALGRAGGKIYGPDGAAAALGLKPTTLYGKMRKHHIEKKPSSRAFG